MELIRFTDMSKSQKNLPDGEAKSKRIIKIVTWSLLVVVMVLVVRFVASVDFSALGDLLRKTPVMLPLVVLMSFISYAASNVAWSLCLSVGGERSLPFWRLFIYRLIGDMLAPFNPTGVVAGETVKVMLMRRDGISVEHALSSVLTHRGLVILANVLMTIVAIFYILMGSAIRGTRGILVALGTVAVMALIFYGLFRLLVHPRLLIGRTVDSIARRTHWSFLSEERIRKTYAANLEAARFFHRHKRRFCLTLGLCMVHWVLGAMEFFVIFTTLGLDVTVMSAIAVEMGVGVFKTLGSVIPGQLGIEEYGNKVMLDLIGVQSNEVWLAASLMRRGRQLFWLAVAGIASLVVYRRRPELKSGE